MDWMYCMKKPIVIIGGIVALALLLAGAAFVGGRLLTGQGLAGGPGLFGGGGKDVVRINPADLQPAEELPQTPADYWGLFDHRQDNSIFITEKVSVNAPAGPMLEVVVTTQTILYEDVTMRQFDGPPPQGQKIQQILEPGTLDEIVQESSIVVWGRRTSDRIIADVLVFKLTPPQNR